MLLTRLIYIFLRLLGRLKYQVMWSRFSSIKGDERVEMDMKELVSHKLVQSNTHVAARFNSIYSDDMIYLLIETFLFTLTYQTIKCK